MSAAATGRRSPVRWAADERYRWTEAARRGSVLQDRARFTLREGLGSGRTAGYALRGSGLVAHLRHGTGDTAGLREIFLNGNYDPPPAAREVLERRAAGHGLRVLDLGGNIGLFALFAFARFPIAALTSFEPDPGNARLLELSRDANGLADRWTLVQACAGAEPGEVRFRAGEHLESRVVEEDEPGAMVLPKHDVLPLLDGVDWLKIDVEGGEWELLADPRFAQAQVPVLALEHHQLGCPASDPRAEVARLLGRAGYRIEPYEERGPGLGELWAVHTGAAGA